MRIDIYKEVSKHMNENIKINFKKTAESLGCDPRTVKRYLKQTPERKPRTLNKKLEPYEDIVKDKVENYSVTAVSLYDFLKKKGYDGSYSLLRKYIKEKRLECQKEAVFRFETEPGLQAQVDWKENFSLVNKNGELFKINIFLYILGNSRFKYIALSLDRKQDTLFDHLDHAFSYTGGVPREILFDNMTTVIDRAYSKLNDVKVNEKMVLFAKEYNFKVVACRPYRPQTKGKVEILAKLIERLRVYNKEFESLEELNEIVKQFNLELNNEKNQSILTVPSECIRVEKKQLQNLPDNSIRECYTRKVITRKVSHESLVNYKAKRYSVPPIHIGKEVEIVPIGDNAIEIVLNGTIIAKHSISNQVMNYMADHMKEIMRTGVFKHKSEDDIQKIAENQLYLLSIGQEAFQ